MLLALLTGFLAFAGRANAQVNPNWDHYHVYTVAPHPSSGFHVSLIDQFGATPHTVQVMNYFANPVQKQHGALVFPINNPQLHYTWWVLDPQPFSKDVIASNQFGDQPLHLSEIDYLLAPALKNAPAGQPLPVANHYKCYACQGNAVNVPVTLVDQFFGRSALVGFPRFFCTPTDKIVQETGQTFPMTDPNQHYTVYEIDPISTGFSATVRDQFLIQGGTVSFPLSVMLMVPTTKSFPTPTESHTWGRLKTLYR